MLKWITLAPLIGAAINGLLGKRIRKALGQEASEKVIGLIACASVAVSAGLAFYNFFGRNWPLVNDKPQITEHFFRWLAVGSFHADFAYLLDPLSGLYILFITGVGLLIHIYAVGYMHGDPGFYRFFAYLNLFMFMMLTLVLADNLLLLFVGWEGVGLCSYLLIGYYIRRDAAGDAAKKAFIMNRIGDFGFMIGMFLVFTTFGTISFVAKNGVPGFLEQAASRPVEAFGALGILTAITLLLFVGATGKSAQIPLYTWLPDAMAGPTPVSALIHAATMVTAGVYLIARCSPLVVKSPTAMMVIALIGAATAFIAATIGLAQSDIKKVLAYSTISQLGYMFLACGVGAFIAGIFHVMTHAFFKALLFLGSGSVIHGMAEEQDIRKMGGLKKYMPITFATMFVGWLAISGVPLLSGFFSKDEILWRTWTTQALPQGWGKGLWVVGWITAGLTAIYMTRMMVLTFWGRERFNNTHKHEEEHEYAEGEHGHHGKPHESPFLMWAPLVILAILSIFGGYLGVSSALSGFAGVQLDNKIEHFLEPAVATFGSHAPVAKTGSETAEAVRQGTGAAGVEAAQESDARLELTFTLLSITIAVLGLLYSFQYFKRNPLWKPPRLLEEKYNVDEFYDATVVNPIEQTSRHVLWKFFDVEVIDGIVNSIAKAFANLADFLRYSQTGYARNYAAVILIGAILVIGYFGFIALR
ncbi:MAG: NADH-quinone oxidoreductase subunit L [Blastocatellia bacterium]|nr:NADH-quinone oxidoreductase subunit L [Blastocatellia bacterium]